MIGSMSRNSQHILVLAALTLASLLPFVGKAVHIDDPLFLWTAKNIVQHPLDPYGFTANWYGVERPMSVITKNPPGASYLLALSGGLFGWDEVALHAVMMLPAIGCIIGIYFLAKRYTLRPLEAALVSLFAPAFLVSATTLMCDVLMLCLWIWSLIVWMNGVERRSTVTLICSALLIVACALVKYFGIAVIGLIAVWTIAEKRRLDRSLVYLIIPIGLLVLYQWWTWVHYGRGLLLDAASYASTTRNTGGINVFSRFVVGLSFTGGCVAFPLFYSVRVWNARSLKMGAIALLCVAVIWTLGFLVSDKSLVLDPEFSWLYVVQFLLWTLVGLMLILLVIVDLRVRRDSGSLLLALWIVGTVTFAILLNWTVNGRTLLPVVPAAGILIFRRCEDCEREGTLRIGVRRYLPFGALAVLALLVAYGDYSLANGIRQDVVTIWSHPRSERSAIWYEGHWGFQYYMDEAGGKPLDIEHSRMFPGDIVITPLNNSSLYQLPAQSLPLRDSLIGAPAFPVSCMNRFAGAGFYSDFWGQMPFVFGEIPPEKYEVHIVVPGDSPK